MYVNIMESKTAFTHRLSDKLKKIWLYYTLFLVLCTVYYGCMEINFFLVWFLSFFFLIHIQNLRINDQEILVILQTTEQAILGIAENDKYIFKSAGKFKIGKKEKKKDGENFMKNKINLKKKNKNKN